MLIAVLSAKGAPGVTTAALALALSWPRPVVLAELDPAGGDVLAGYGRGEQAADGLGELILAARRGDLPARLDAHLLQLDPAGRVRLLAGLADPTAAAHVDWSRMAGGLDTIGDGATDVLADCGRLRTEHFPTPVVNQAAAVVVVTGSNLRAVRAASQAIAHLRREEAEPGAGPVAAMVVAPGEPYTEREIADALGVPVIGALPRNAKTAAVLSDGAPAGRGFAQSALMRAARSVAVNMVAFAASRHGVLAPAWSASGDPVDSVGPIRG
jgi:MinD-like ATPase involved in chromosome partitioning or flagellar assembly